MIKWSIYKRWRIERSIFLQYYPAHKALIIPELASRMTDNEFTSAVGTKISSYSTAIFHSKGKKVYSYCFLQLLSPSNTSKASATFSANSNGSSIDSK